MAEYRLSPAAQRDLNDIFDYTASQWGLPQALRYLDLVEEACADLSRAPLQAPACAHIRPGYRRRRIEHHVIYFRPTRYGVAVVRILHQHMDATRHL